MNYIWRPYIDAIRAGFETSKINFRICDDDGYYGIEHYSMSANFEYWPRSIDPYGIEDLEAKYSCVDINPYFRPEIEEIFDCLIRSEKGVLPEEMVPPERYDPNLFILFDVLTHLIANVDRIRGMRKRDFYIIMFMDEMEGNETVGYLGKDIELFNVAEKRILAEMLIRFYETSDYIKCLEETLGLIMDDFEMFISDNSKIIFYNKFGFDEDEKVYEKIYENEDKRLQYIINLFLPVGIKYVLHRKLTYGVIGNDRSMILGGFVL